jgi:hypothetical protein
MKWTLHEGFDQSCTEECTLKLDLKRENSVCAFLKVSRMPFVSTGELHEAIETQSENKNGPRMKD